jgi:hypothetical protein
MALGTFAIGTEGFMIAPLLPSLAEDLSVGLVAAGHNEAANDGERRSCRRAHDRRHERKVESAQGPRGDVDRRDGRERGPRDARHVHAWP